jgi:thiamine biosynthesis lipoprotein
MDTASEVQASALSRRKFLVLGTGLLALAGARWWLERSSPPPCFLERAGLKLVRGATQAFGTDVTVLVAHEDERQARVAIDAALHEALEVDRLMSLYRADSQVRVLNTHGWLEHPHPRLLEVLRVAQEVSARTGGAFDVTVQPLWEVYAGAKGDGRLPTKTEIERARALVDWRKLEIFDALVRFTRPGMAITLNGIAQGFAGDRMRVALEAHGISNALVNSGEIGGDGLNATREPWRVGVKRPGVDAVLGVVRVDGRFIATSADDQTVFSADRVHHHIFDPATGYSPPMVSSVTVIAPTGVLADALSTAVFVLGPKRGLAFASGTLGVEALIVSKDGCVRMTENFPLEPKPGA